MTHFGPSGVVQEGYAYNNAVFPHLPIAVTNAVGEVRTNYYDAQYRLSTVTVPATGLRTTYNYAATNQNLSSVVASVSGTPLSTNSYTWSNGRMATSTDSRGLTVNYTWDGLGRPLTQVYRVLSARVREGGWWRG